MDERQAMAMFESGEAFGVSVNVIIMEANGRVYFSMDGHRWVESDHPALRECIDGAKKIPGGSDSGD